MVYEFRHFLSMLLLLSWPPVREVCLNHEVEMFLPRIGTFPDLSSVAYCCVAILLSTTPTFPSATRCLPGGGGSNPAPSPSPSPPALSPHSFIRSPGHPLSSSQHTKTLRSLIQILLPVRFPRYAFCLTVAAPLPPLKYILI